MFQPSIFPASLATRSLFWSGVVALVLGVSMVVAQEGQPNADVGSQASIGQAGEGGQGAKRERLREGTKIVDQAGHFETTGGSPMFVTEDGMEFGGLENLNLERIVRTLSENPDRLIWSISGTITEYQGSNYLQIDRAVLKTKNIRRSGNQGTNPSTANRSSQPFSPLAGPLAPGS